MPTDNTQLSRAQHSNQYLLQCFMLLFFHYQHTKLAIQSFLSHGFLFTLKVHHLINHLNGLCFPLPSTVSIENSLNNNIPSVVLPFTPFISIQTTNISRKQSSIIHLLLLTLKANPFINHSNCFSFPLKPTVSKENLIWFSFYTDRQSPQ